MINRDHDGSCPGQDPCHLQVYLTDDFGSVQPLQFQTMSLISGRKSMAGSMIGGIKETQEMIDFCGECISVDKHGVVWSSADINLGLDPFHKRFAMFFYVLTLNLEA